MKYILVERHFNALSKQELADSDALARAADREHYSAAVNWSSVIKAPRIVILAEAGSGKTEEMRQQVKVLNEQGKPAFFLPLEDVAEEYVEDLLRGEALQSFEGWKAVQQNDIAWFFS